MKIVLDKREMRKLRKNMKKVEKAYGKARVKKIIESKAGVFVEAAKRRAPKSPKKFHTYTNRNGDTVKIWSGNLQKSIMILKRGKFKRSDAVWVGPKYLRNAKGKSYGKGKRVNAYYAHFVEFGTRKNRAKPFMRPAFDQVRPVYFGLVANAMRGILKRTNTN